MDSNAFDRWTRARAATTNRRALIGVSLTAGVASVLSRVLPASAQFGGSGTCTYNVTLTSSITANATVTGSLVIDIGDGGAIDSGSLTFTGQRAASVVGQATGPAIDLLASLSDGTMLSLTGVANAAISDCSGSILGSIANSGTGQVGTWQAVSGAGSSSSTTTLPPPSGQSTSGSSTGSSSSTGSGSGSGNGSGSGGGNGGSCLELQSQCNDNSECCSGFCTDNECRSCGGMMCDNHCIDPNLDPENCGGCGNFCDSGVCNGGFCNGPDGPDGGDNGGGGGCGVENGGGCDFDAQCCSGWCNGGMCASCNLSKVCDGQCVDVFSDNNHCGNCNSPCFSPQFCSGGACQG